MAAGLVVDAGVLYAAADQDEARYAACRELLEGHPGPLYVSTLVVAEVTSFLAERMGAEAEIRFLQAIAGGEVLVEHPAMADWLRIAELVWTYRDWPLGTTDASTVALAERKGVTRVATLDHRHLAAVRPNHVEAFELLP